VEEAQAYKKGPSVVRESYSGKGGEKVNWLLDAWGGGKRGRKRDWREKLQDAAALETTAVRPALTQRWREDKKKKNQAKKRWERDLIICETVKIQARVTRPAPKGKGGGKKKTGD